MQPVIDVRSAQRRAELETRKRRKQDGRIDAAAVRDDYARAVDRRRPTLERRTNARDERLRRRVINDIGIEPRHARTALRRGADSHLAEHAVAREPPPALRDQVGDRQLLELA